VSTPYLPPRPDVSPDLTKPCVRCALYWRPSWLERMLLGQDSLCYARDVRGSVPDPVTGDIKLNPPVPCATARALGGRCGPKAVHFAYRSPG
jgi:hypothetical protein